MSYCALADQFGQINVPVTFRTNQQTNIVQKKKRVTFCKTEIPHVEYYYFATSLLVYCFGVCY